MPYLKSLAPNAGPPSVFKKYPDVYRAWSETSQAMMNGPSPLSAGERELILAYAAGVAGCSFVLTGHSEVASAWGLERGLAERLLEDPETTSIDARLRVLIHFARKLTLAPNELTAEDAEQVYAEGWDEDALHSVVAICARAAFMHRLVAGCGFAPLDPEVARSHAAKRVSEGYVNIYRAFREPKPAE